MRLTFDDGTLLLEDAPDSVPYAEWDDRVDEYRAQAYRFLILYLFLRCSVSNALDPPFTIGTQGRSTA